MVTLMKPKCYIHIGMHKTGSTSIQETFDKLKMPDIDYLRIDPFTSNQSRALATMLWESPETYHAHIKSGLSIQEVVQARNNYEASFHAVLSSSHAGAILLSAEDLSHRDFSLQSIAKLKSMLDPYVSGYEIICYIRPPVSFMQSAYQQVIKDGADWFSIDKLFPRYKEGLEKFELIFGRASLNFRVFSLKSFPQSNVVMDFAEIMGAKIGLNDTLRENDSVSLEAMSLLYIQRKFGRGYGSYKGSHSDNQRMITALQEIGQGKLVFCRELVEPIINENMEELEWIEGVLGQRIIDLPEVGTEGCIKDEDDFISMGMAVSSKLVSLVFARKMDKVCSVNEVVRLVEELMFDGDAKLVPRKDIIDDSLALEKVLDFKLRNINTEAPDVLRELAVFFEKKGDSEAAKKLISMAYGLRPGPVISSCYNRIFKLNDF
ncbi:MAG: hypothetical protein B7Y40_06940 [Gammaproteobacteria bacterium 28-57-27]|nr:MAG: hypothetical protein B7Y40_06940 [Gammaproteobacteria bacterium 28-57-27]